jgi:elongation factor G
VFSGTLKSDAHVWNSVKGRDERIGQLVTVRGKNQEPVAQIVAGDIGAVPKLAETTTGDTLATKEQPLVIEGASYPEPLFAVALHPKTRGDLDKLGPILQRIAGEDPTIRIHRDPETGETVMSGMGETQIDTAVERMKRLGVEVTTSVPRVAYRETVSHKVNSEYKHKKQTGGHGQYGHVFLEIEPLPRGTGFEFGDRVVGGVVPKQFIPAVEKGVSEALHEGVLAHYPVVDVKVVLYDGSYHDVDSNEMSFKMAASQAFKKGVEKAAPVLLEPIVTSRSLSPISSWATS